MVNRGVVSAHLMRNRQMIKEHGDPDSQGWWLLFIMWIAGTIICNYIWTSYP